MRVGAGPYAHVATGATLQIEQKKALRLHQSLRQELVNGYAAHPLRADAITLHPFLGHILKPAPNFGESVEHHLEVFASNFHHFNVVESRAGCGSVGAAQEGDFAEVPSSCQIGKDKASTGTLL